MKAQGKKQKESADREKDSSSIVEGKTKGYTTRIESITKTGDPKKRAMSAYKPQHSYSENQRFVSRIRRIVDAGIDEQFASGNPVVFPDRISQEFGQEYGTLESLFFQIQDVRIKEYILTRKVEKVKEILVYTDCPLPEITRLLGFDSVAQLSRVLKKYTGYTFEYFVNIRREKRAVMQKVGENRGEKAKTLEVQPE